jgi:hypothetical protein
MVLRTFPRPTFNSTTRRHPNIGRPQHHRNTGNVMFGEPSTPGAEQDAFAMADAQRTQPRGRTPVQLRRRRQVVAPSAPYTPLVSRRTAAEADNSLAEFTLDGITRSAKPGRRQPPVEYTTRFRYRDRALVRPQMRAPYSRRSARLDCPTPPAWRRLSPTEGACWSCCTPRGTSGIRPVDSPSPYWARQIKDRPRDVSRRATSASC